MDGRAHAARGRQGDVDGLAIAERADDGDLRQAAVIAMQALHGVIDMLFTAKNFDARHGALDVLAVDTAGGQLSALQTVSFLPPGFAGEPWGAELRLTPDARFLYASERRSSTLAGFAVGLVDSSLTPLLRELAAGDQVLLEAIERGRPRGAEIGPAP